ncbi:hypothetical protein WOLCODRAFT_19372 [Wolfiporia cocos MD-104 SS10]|uniref:Uncharacterized protein n=1 Tax=Wolfiporia cocos (strain MD-104) TaxID=742152 RepID=A0A2H3JSJ3_WOLCO|nr:hypothetical protein WOLCODRAFT_19372 [Wolfiporia cocos MD-104 SS10]
MDREHHRSEGQSRLEGELFSSDDSQIQLKTADKLSPSASPQNQDEVDELVQLLEALAKTWEPDEVQYDGDFELKKREQMGRIRCIGIQAAAEGRRRIALDEEKAESVRAEAQRLLQRDRDRAAIEYCYNIVDAYAASAAEDPDERSWRCQRS